MGWYRSQLYIKQENPLSYEYALNMNEVDGNLVRTVGSDGRIGQFSPSTFNIPVVIPSENQKYIYGQGSSFSSLPNFNSDILFTSNYYANYNGLLYNCNSFNRPINLMNVGNFDYFVSDCDNFDSEINIVSDWESMGNHVIADCPNFNSDIHISGTRYITNIVYNCNNFRDRAIYFNNVNYVSLSSGYIVNCGNNMRIYAYGGNYFQISVNRNSLQKNDLVNSYYIHDVNRVFASVSTNSNNLNFSDVFIDNAINSASFGFSSKSGQRLNIDNIYISNTNSLSMTCTLVGGGINIGNIILTNCNNLYGTINSNSGTLRISNYTLKDVTFDPNAYVWLFNDFKNTTNINVYMENITSSNITTLFSNLNIDAVTNLNLTIKNVNPINGTFIVLDTVNSKYYKYSYDNFSFNFDDIPENMIVWSQLLQLNLNGRIRIFVNANNIYGRVFNGSFTRTDGYVNLVINAAGKISIPTDKALINVDSINNSLFNTGTIDIYTTNYFSASIYSSPPNDRTPIPSLIFNTDGEITLANVMSRIRSNSFNVKIFSNPERTPTSINASNLVYSQNYRVAHNFYCDQTMFDLLNNVKTLQGTFVYGAAITSWSAQTNCMYNADYNIRIYNNYTL